MRLKASALLTNIRKFLSHTLNKDFLVFLFFLGLSSIFWLLMTLNETYEEELSIPVRMVDVPRNVVVTTPPCDTVKVTVKDKGFVLLTYIYSHRLRPIQVDFQDYADIKLGKGHLPAADLQKMIYPQLHNSSRIVLFKADQLDFYFNYGQSKRVPIRLDGVVVPGGNYYISQVKFSPSRVTIYANKHLLDSITSMGTVDVHFTNVLDTIYQTVNLKQIEGVKCVPSTVRLRIAPDILTEESMDVPITAINMPEGKVLRTFPSRVKVNFVVGASLFRTVKPSGFKVVADYRYLSQHPSDKCSLYIKQVPANVHKARLALQQVDYLIEQQ